MIERRIEAGSAEIFVVDGDHADKPALCLINGATTNLTSWAPLLPQIENDFRVVRHDVRGTGRSGPGLDLSGYEIDSYADDLAAVLEHLSIERAIVCGMAFGARIALQVAVRHPEKVGLLALYDATVSAPASIQQREDGIAKARQLRVNAGFIELSRDESWFEHADKKSARLAWGAASRQPDQSHVLGRVKAPTLIATGEQDNNLTASRLMAERIPDAEFHLMEMCGHGSLFERPALFAELLLNFIERRY